MSRRALLALLPLVVVIACGGKPYRSTQGSRIVRFQLASRLVQRTLAETLVVPAGGGAGRPLLVLLHGRSANADQFLGDWAAVCLSCGYAQRYFDESEGELPSACPQCGGELRSHCPSCGARFSSVFAVECEACGAELRPDEMHGVPIRKPPKL